MENKGNKIQMGSFLFDINGEQQSCPQGAKNYAAAKQT